jgi:CRP/FNR family transcriptional regulator, cyclic AMP receptor protein
MSLASRDQWPESSFVGQLPETERVALLAAGVPVRFDDNAILLLQGETAECVYVLTNGLVKVIVAAESGAETTLAIRSRGDLIGEFALLDEKPRTATARAVGEVTALKITGAAFMQITGESVAMQGAVTRYLLSKMRATTERRAAERVWDAKERLAQVLYDLGRLHAQLGPDGVVRVPITQSELGELAGVAVSTTERVLKDLRKQGVVTTRYREITIRDMTYLDSLRFPQEAA